ncbi:MAG: alkene reductase [Xanthomonadaceae bacterium]|nr:alkene reductase [Xanthomonadaceae bacterium]MDP2184279.1 alkene reductase [Xanthomonadales bacterium]MDZ4114825.1 alkene reductase [Xanthomonadaceae bacterium]MDZ4377388.1 alkene reductase [Xanthomonadaceae bacterium]
MTAPTALLKPLTLGDILLSNRIAMAPLTRNRAAADNVPGPLAALYYTQRASVGLIISEATQISPMGQGYIATPGIHSAEQVAGWRKVTQAVHEADGHIFMQLWHVGRISHSSLLPDGQAPVAPSAIRAASKTFTAEGFVDVSMPRALSTEDIAQTVADYRQAARNAIDAGFDGVEVHSANGYLIDQFLRDSSNQRSDAYGGSIENRTRFLREVVSAVADAIGAQRVGVRFSPVSGFNDISDSAPQPLFEAAVAQMQAIGIAYVHVIEGETGGDRNTPFFDYSALRSHFKGVWMVNNGYDADMAEATISSGRADMVAIGRPLIANPDYLARIAQGAALNPLDQATLYGGDARGYTDYPVLGQ